MGIEKQIEEMNKEQQIEEIANIIFDTLKKTFNATFKDVVKALYLAGYHKTFTSDFASDTQKAYKEGYDKGFLDGREEFDIILQRNKQLLQAREISKSDIERLKTQLQQANAGIVNCIGCHLVELNAVNEFANKLKNKLFDFFQENEGLDGKISLGSLYVDVNATPYTFD